VRSEGWELELACLVKHELGVLDSVSGEGGRVRPAAMQPSSGSMSIEGSWRRFSETASVSAPPRA
jgi:hypothetical protein